jgi:hypothetical protein
VVPALTVLNDSSSARERAVAWILNTRGREGHWLWRWKFKTSDRQVHFDPDKFGWPWILGANSWVIPTAFTLVALKQFTACARSELADGRIRTGIDMLLDRACLGGGWNAGNSVVYGVTLAAHVEPTAIALLALQDGPRTELVCQSVAWLKARAGELQAVLHARCRVRFHALRIGRRETRDERTRAGGAGRRPHRCSIGHHE